MAVTWGEWGTEVIRSSAERWLGDRLGEPLRMAPGGAQYPPVPARVEVDTRTGEVKPCKRRRRKRLLTPTDLSDLAALQAIVGKGDALKLAVAKAVRR